MTRQFTYSFRPRVSIYEGSSPNRGFAPVLLNHQQRAQSSTNPSKSSQFTTQFNAEKSRSARLTLLAICYNGTLTGMLKQSICEGPGFEPCRLAALDLCEHSIFDFSWLRREERVMSSNCDN